MNDSIYKKYCEQKLPHDFQKRAEGFVSMSDTVQEEKELLANAKTNEERKVCKT